MKESIIRDKSYKFASRIVKIYKFLTTEQREFVLSKQLLRSGTAIGALIREGQYAQSDLDFIHKFSIALKEANETQYWLELLKDNDFIDEKSFISINNDCVELIKLLTSIIITMKEKVKK